jgi:hypothetical protein
MEKISVRREDNLFALNGRPTVLRMRSSFKFMAWLNQHLSGSPRGGNPLDKARRWAKRVKDLGFHGMRVFGETADWGDLHEQRPGDHPFFGQYPWNNGVWDINALKRGHRPREVTPLNRQMITALVDILQEFGLVAEYVTNATLKHTDGVPYEVIGHCARQTARLMREIEQERGGNNLFHSLINEWDAHQNGFKQERAAGKSQQQARQAVLDELNMQFVRHRRVKNGKPEQWPEGLVMADHGGRNTVEYTVGRPDGADIWVIHPTRNGRWWERTNLGPETEIRYYSESMHYMDLTAWESRSLPGPDPGKAFPPGKEMFRPASTTTEVQKYIDFMEQTLENGISFCMHDFEGMASDPDRELNKIEQYLSGAQPSPGPDPSPDPEIPYFPYGHIITAAYRDILQRDADIEGLKHYNERLKSGHMSEARLRDALMRSKEFADKFFKSPV